MKQHTTLLASLVLLAAISLVFVTGGPTLNIMSLISPHSQLASLNDSSSGLVGWWKFDEGVGSTAADSNPTGAANNGTFVGSPTWTTGQISQAISLNGSTDYINVPNFTALNGLTTATISLWINVPSVASGKAIISQWNNGRLFEIDQGPNNNIYVYWQYGGSGGGGTSLVQASSNNSITPGIWQHVVVVYNNGTSQIYVNGSQVGSQSGGGTLNSGVTDPLRIGWNNVPTFFGGSIDDLRIYNSALTSDQIATLYADGTGTTPPPPSTYTLTVTNQNTSGGTVTSNPNGVNCGTTCTLSNLSTGSTTILSAATSTGYTTNWISGCTSSNGNTCTVTMGSSNATVTVNFSNGITPPPSISSVSASSITQSGATITWTTNQPSTSEVYYGLTSAYGSNSTLTDTSPMQTTHSVNLMSLASSTVYNYEVVSTNANGSATSTPNQTFTTLAPVVQQSGNATCEAVSPAICWYVDPQATGANNGGNVNRVATANPWNDAWTSVFSIYNVQPGDFVYLSGGTNSQIYTLPGPGYSSWHPVGGAAGAPVTYKVGQDAGHNGIVTFDASRYWLNSQIASTTSGGAGDIAVVIPSHIVFNGNYGGQKHWTFQNYFNSAIYSENGKIDQKLTYLNVDSTIFLGLSSQYELDHSLIRIPKTQGGGQLDQLVGITLGGDYYVGAYGLSSIHDNVIDGFDNYNLSPDPLTYGAGSWDFGWPGSVDIHNNYVRHYFAPYSWGYHHDIMPGGHPYVRIFNNYMSEVGSSNRVYLGSHDDSPNGLSHVYIYNNIIDTPTLSAAVNRGGIPITMGADAPTLSDVKFDDVKIFNNAIIDTPYFPIGISSYWPITPTGVEVANNIIFNSGGQGDSAISMTNFCQPIDRLSNNLLDAGQSGSTKVTYSTVNLYSHGSYHGTCSTVPSVNTQNTKTWSGVAGFQLYTPYSPSNNYRLSANDTIAKGGGVNLSSYCTTDKAGPWLCAGMNGVARPSGSPWDIGPYESGASSDNSVPTAPSNLYATIPHWTEVTLDWTESTDNVGVVGYYIYRDGQLINSIGAPEYTDPGRDAATSYTYTVRAIDAAGNLSQPGSVTVTTPAATKSFNIGDTVRTVFYESGTAADPLSADEVIVWNSPSWQTSAPSSLPRLYQNSQGIIIDGPTYADGYAWWDIQWTSGKYDCDGVGQHCTVLTPTASITGWTPEGIGDAMILQNVNHEASDNVTISKVTSGGASGRVKEIDNAGNIDCGSTCSQSFPFGSIIVFVAVPDAGSTFIGWQGGGCSGKRAYCGTQVTSARTIQAIFALQGTTPPPPSYYTLTLANGGTGTGSVTDGTVTCGSNCSDSILSGGSVTLTVTPGNGSTFTGWAVSGSSSGTCTGTTSPCSLTITSNTTVTATFSGGSSSEDCSAAHTLCVSNTPVSGQTIPYTTIQACANAARAGDTCLVFPGYYPENVLITNGGTSGNPVTFKAVNSASNKSTPQNQLSTMQGFEVNAPYAIMDGFDISKYVVGPALHQSDPSNGSNPSYIYLTWQANYCQITNNVIRDGTYLSSTGYNFDATHYTITVPAPGDFLAAGFIPGMQIYIGSSITPAILNANETLQVTAVSSSTLTVANGSTMYSENNAQATIYNSTYTRNGVDGIAFDNDSGHPIESNCLVSGNTFKNLAGVGLSHNGDNDVISNNTWENMHGFGMIIFDGSNNLFTHNVLENSPRWPGFTTISTIAEGKWDMYDVWLYSAPYSGLPTNNNTFEYNIISNIDNEGESTNLINVGGVGSGIILRNNVFYGISGPPDGSHFPYSQYINNSWVNSYPGADAVFILGASSNGNPINSTIKNNAFVGNSTSSPRVGYGWYSATASFLATPADYDFVAGPAPTFAAKPLFAGTEAHTIANGLNGGDPKFQNINDPVGPDGIPFTADDGLIPQAGSPLCTGGEGGTYIGAYPCASGTITYPPTVSASASPSSITLPTNSATLTGTASDPQSLAMTYLWSVSPSSNVTITSPTSLSTSATFPNTAGTYTFTLTATDSDSLSSSATAQVTVNSQSATVPGAPTIGTASAGNAQASVSFTAPASNGGATITNYTVTSNTGNHTGTGTASPITVSGLTNGTPYTFTVTATNSVGTGSASAASNSVTPVLSSATTYTFTGPSSGNVGSASTNFTITPNSSYTGTITITPTGAGSSGISAITRTFSNSSTAQTFAITPTTAGSITLTPTSNPSLTNPTTLTYTANSVADTQAPTVTTFTIPSTSTSLAVSSITVTASDNTSVTGYMLTETNSAPASGAVGWTSSAPTSYTFSTAGAKTLYAWAKDAAGNVSTSRSASVTITLPPGTNLPPTVSMSVTPTSATSPASITLTATASDSDGTVSHVDFYNGSTLLSTTSSPYTYTWSGVTTGTYSLTAKAYDNLGSSTISSPVTVTVNDVAPTDLCPNIDGVQTTIPSGMIISGGSCITPYYGGGGGGGGGSAPTPTLAVSLTSPINRTTYAFNSNVPILATAQSATKVDFQIATATPMLQGTTTVLYTSTSTLLYSDTSYPYSYNYTATVPGIYVITAKATGSYGNSTTSQPVIIGVSTIVPTSTILIQPALITPPTIITVPGCPTNMICTPKPVTVPNCPSGMVCTPNTSGTNSGTGITPPSNPGTSSYGSITTWIVLGTTNSQVKTLQQILNGNGYTVAVRGNGSLGHESTYAGSLTISALKKFQCANIGVCSGTPTTTGYGATGPKTRAALNKLGGNTSYQLPTQTPITPSAQVQTPVPTTVLIASSIPSSFTFTHQIHVNTTDSDVIYLQMFLNSHGYTVANTGSGSKGHESTYFGSATIKALAAFQRDNNITPAYGNFGMVTAQKINAVMGK